MKILIVCATKPEIDPLLHDLNAAGALSGQWDEFVYKDHEIKILISGIGSTLTAYSLTAELKKSKYGLVINAGIAGSFDPGTLIGDVLLVTQEIFADLGAGEETGFKTVFELGLAGPDEYPFRQGRLNHNYPESLAVVLKKYKKVAGITLNTATGQKSSAEALYSAFSPAVETMEGAAVFYVCLMENIPFIQLRAVSNYVGNRNKTDWNIPLATSTLATEIINILNQLN